jgi:hypothetical protein
MEQRSTPSESPSPSSMPPGGLQGHPVGASKRRTALYAVIVIVVVAVVAVAALAAEGVFSPKKAPSPKPKPQVITKQLIDTPGSTFGPGTASAAVLVATFPTNYSSAWINGTFAVTVCTTFGDYCLANAAIVTPANWQNIQSGGTVSAVWCYSVQNHCQSEKATAISSGNLTGYWGQSLDVCLWSNATTESQQFSADITFTYILPG